MRYPDHLLKLIELFKKFPGIGARSAERFAFELINWPEEKLNQMGQLVGQTKDKLKRCEQCGALIGIESCHFCTVDRAQSGLLCIVASPKDVFLIEGTRNYDGLYHVLGALLSPIHDQGPSAAMVEKIKNRIQESNVKEVIFALDSTIEGDATALFLKRELLSLAVTTSRLALGLPMGSSLDFIDGGTLTRAFQGRLSY